MVMSIIIVRAKLSSFHLFSSYDTFPSTFLTTPQVSIWKPYFYELALLELLKVDTDDFLSTVRKWPCELYNVGAVSKALMEELLVKPNSVPLQLALATIFERQGQLDKAMAMYLKLQHTDVFKFIHANELYPDVANHAIDLMELDSDKAVELFMMEDPRIDIEAIVHRMLNQNKHLFK